MLSHIKNTFYILHVYHEYINFFMDNVGGDGDHKVGAPSFSTILKVATHDRQHVEGMVQG